MMRRITAEQYYEHPYQPGLHVVLLCLPDDLAETAAAPLARLAQRAPNLHIWVCQVQSVEDAETVQALRYPQYRIIRDGSERYQHTGLLDDAQIEDALDNLGE
jgi:hypothetical protein